MIPDDDGVESTEYERVHAASDVADQLVAEAHTIAEAFPSWDVIVSSGEYRGYGVSYGVGSEAQVIWLDYYSVEPETGIVDTIIDEIAEHLDQHGLDE